MKYKITTIIEDDKILRGQSPKKLAEKVGVSRVYMSKVKNNKVVATEALYNKIRKALTSD